MVLLKDVGWREKASFKLPVSEKLGENSFEVHAIPLSVWEFYLRFVGEHVPIEWVEN